MASDASPPSSQAPSPSGASSGSSSESSKGGEGPPKTLLQRLTRFLRSSAVGLAATAADFAVLEVGVRLMHFDAPKVKIVSTLVGIAVQFIGNRTFAFHASEGKLSRQIALFCVVETGTLTLNWLLFRFFTHSLHWPLELTNVIVTCAVYIGFSYPAWRIVFRVRKEDRGHPTGSGKPSDAA